MIVLLLFNFLPALESSFRPEVQLRVTFSGKVVVTEFNSRQASQLRWRRGRVGLLIDGDTGCVTSREPGEVDEALAL